MGSVQLLKFHTEFRQFVHKLQKFFGYIADRQSSI